MGGAMESRGLFPIGLSQMDFVRQYAKVAHVRSAGMCTVLLRTLGDGWCVGSIWASLLRRQHGAICFPLRAIVAQRWPLFWYESGF